VGAALLALLFATLGVVAYYWDTHRLRAIAIVAVAYAIAAGLALWRVKAMRESAPPLLGATIDQLKRDAHALDPRDRSGA